MESKRVLFITFDMSGYYDSVREELEQRYSDVTYYNAATARYKYKSLGEKVHAFFYKLFKGQKLKNFYKYRDFISQVGNNTYDITLVVRPDLFFDSQLETLRRSSGRLIAYYHDSVNNIPRKKDVIRFFDSVWTYEKKDAQDYNLKQTTNFIYCGKHPRVWPAKVKAFSVMSADYRLPVLVKVAEFLKTQGQSYRFFVMDDKPRSSDTVTFVTRRMGNAEVVDEIKNCDIIVDIHKFGVQDGLTFRTFEAMGFGKKLITTNRDIVNYDFYDPNNIFVVDPTAKVAIPETFFSTPYHEIPNQIFEKYTVSAWLDTVLS